MATSPNFVGLPRLEVVALTTANSNYNGSTGAYQDCFTGGNSGSRIHKITYQSTGASTAGGVIRAFVRHASLGWVSLWNEWAVGALAAGTTVARNRRELYDASGQGLPLLILPSGVSLRFSTEKADTCNIIVEGGDF